MSKTYVVIGANYGDEGKGRCVRFIADKERKAGVDTKDILVIKHNGGAQAGHTSRGFVHHTLGSGDCDTYLSPEFIFNPMALESELMQYAIKKQMIYRHKIYVNENCRVTTPIDILMNHIIEVVRGGKKHGSCGMGIYSTITRDKSVKIPVYKVYNAAVSGNDKLKHELIEKLIIHYEGYVHAIRFIPEQFQDLDLERMMEDFFDCAKKVLTDPTIQIISNNGEFRLLNEKKVVIFETGQGLMLDEENEESFPHVTPSHTNHINPVNIINRARLGRNDTTVVYCTRTYMTKHGAGKINAIPLPEDIIEKYNLRELDKTNVPNQWQDSIRYFYLPLYRMLDRVEEDFNQFMKKVFWLDEEDKCGITLERKFFITWADVTTEIIGFPISLERLIRAKDVLNYEEEIEGGQYAL